MLSLPFGYFCPDERIFVLLNRRDLPPEFVSSQNLFELGEPVRNSLLCLSVSCVLALVSGCGGGQQRVVQVIKVSVSPQSAVVGAAQLTTFTAMVTGNTSGVDWSVNGIASGNSTVGTIDASGNYTAPAVITNATATVSAASKHDPSKTGSATVTIIAPGIVAATANVQVARYTITPPAGAAASIEFGPDTAYGLTTWQVLAPQVAGDVLIDLDENHNPVWLWSSF